MTELLFLDDAYLRACDATVTKVDGEEHRVVLDRTVFYATGGGQPHDTGTLSAGDAVASVVNVRKADGEVWHWLDPEAPLPELGSTVAAEIDWDRRHQLMRTHSALHTMGGVIWNEYGALATGGNMDPLKGRLDYDLGPTPEGFKERITEAVNAEIAADRAIEVSYLDRPASMADPDLIRTKVNLIPDDVQQIRVVDIVGLDKQADGGTHVRSTAEIGRFEITKIENKGKGNKRIRIALHDY